MSETADKEPGDGNIENWNEWDNDELDISSDVDVDAIKIEDSVVHFSVEESSHANCVSKLTYEKEKRSWEDALEGISQRLSNETSVVESMKNNALSDKKRIQQLELDKKDALSYKETFDRLQQQIVSLNDLLFEANEEIAAHKRHEESLENQIEELESKLYGPVNFYYQEYMNSLEEIRSLETDSDGLRDQLRQVKDIMRNMIIDQQRAPTQDDLLKEREIFSKQISSFEKRIEELEEEKHSLRDNVEK